MPKVQKIDMGKESQCVRIRLYDRGKTKVPPIFANSAPHSRPGRAMHIVAVIQFPWNWNGKEEEEER